uniref:Ced-7 n=1 Tax=Pristionchus pacificus TaxID=54126 RepID=A0A2A6BBK3_PRIPA|eukprot:PDM63259.1 ced-7 [Pristionchus pacificus]
MLRGYSLSNDVDDSYAPLSPDRNRRRTTTKDKMTRALRQLTLLTWKNLVVLRRSIVWTIFEMVTPLLFFALIWIIMQNITIEEKKGHRFPDLTLYGNGSDFDSNGCPLTCVNRRKKMTLLYSLGDSVITSEADRLLQGVAGRFRESKDVTVDVEAVREGRGEMEKQLRVDYKEEGAFCEQKYIGGLFIDRMDLTGGSVDSQLGMRAFPQPDHAESSLDILLNLAHIMFALMTISIVLHTAREIAAESESGMKDFLMVMGMGRGVFYLSHILMAFAKAAIAIVVNCIPFFMFLPLISPSLLLVTVLLYSMAVICMAALVAAIFRSTQGAIKVSVILTIVLALVCLAAPARESLPWASLASLNPNQALSYAFHAFVEAVKKGDPLTWSSSFSDASLVFPVGLAIVMLIVDVLLLIGLTILVDWFVSSSDSPLALLTKMFYKSPLNHSTSLPRSLNGAEETDSALVHADICLENVVKCFDSQRAVDEMSMKAYKGQVTVLLGHNGAGKSTTFNMICGLTSPTAGAIQICGMDVSEHLATCQEKIGYCPQGNPLFNLLTVDEHLEFFARLKRIETNQWRGDREELLECLKLRDKRTTRSAHLSGGMKRKLCVGMALIARSEVILLDEPTAGMDPAARRDIEKILEKYKKDSTILMTTHYTDEAEQLGDRMVIMAKGSVVCSGSGNFLKKKFCTGYVLTVVMSEKNVEVERGVVALVERHVKGVMVAGMSGLQMDVSLPKDQYPRFPALFAELELDAARLGVTSFGLSLNTLEQVFLRVGELADPQDSIDGGGVLRRVKEVIDNKPSGGNFSERALMSMKALLWKRWLYSKAHLSVFISQFIVPILILFLVANILNLLSISTGQDRKMSLAALPPSRFVIFDQSMPKELPKEYLQRVTKMKNVNPVQVAAQSPDDWILNQRLSRPPFSAGISVDTDTHPRVHHSEVIIHSLPAAITLVDGVRYGVDISSSMHLYSLSADKAVDPSGSPMDQIIKSGMTGPVFAIIFSLLTSPFITFPIVDRASKFVHQQLLTGVPRVLFWLAYFSFDTLIFLIGCTSYLLVFIVTDWLMGYHTVLFLLWLSYYVASIFLIYTASFVFDSPSKGHIVLFFYQVLVTLAAFILVALVDLGIIAAAEWQSVVEGAIMILVPSFALCKGGYLISRAHIAGSMLPIDARPTEWALMEWDQLGRVFTYLLVMAAVSLTLFILIQQNRIRRAINCVWNSMHSAVVGVRGANEGGPEDEGVAIERTMMNTLPINQVPLAINNLTKRYGRFRAIDSISFGVRSRECFGLLGVNGAGKSTTFSIITGDNLYYSGEALPTEGSCHVYGKSVVDGNVRMGYCPQADALLPELTGRQVLEILASLHGYVDARAKCRAILRAVGMEEHADKETGKYSGGQRRKLSTGVSILAQSRLVVLDEPTAGIDPKARREIWSVINGIREGGDTAILLTSHSMDECEALCSRIGVLSRGHLVALGSSQVLKSKYGNSYTLTIVMADGARKEDVEYEVKREFPGAEMKPSHSSTLVFEMARSRDSLWSETFKRAIALAERVYAKDFCLTQSSLQQTFMQIAHD